MPPSSPNLELKKASSLRLEVDQTLLLLSSLNATYTTTNMLSPSPASLSTSTSTSPSAVQNTHKTRANLRKTIEKRVNEITDFIDSNIGDERCLLFERQRGRLRMGLQRFDTSSSSSSSNGGLNASISTTTSPTLVINTALKITSLRQTQTPTTTTKSTVKFSEPLSPTPSTISKKSHQGSEPRSPRDTLNGMSSSLKSPLKEVMRKKFITGMSQPSAVKQQSSPRIGSVGGSSTKKYRYKPLYAWEVTPNPNRSSIQAQTSSLQTPIVNNNLINDMNDEVGIGDVIVESERKKIVNHRGVYVPTVNSPGFYSLVHDKVRRNDDESDVNDSNEEDYKIKKINTTPNNHKSIDFTIILTPAEYALCLQKRRLHYALKTHQNRFQQPLQSQQMQNKNGSFGGGGEGVFLGISSPFVDKDDIDRFLYRSG